MKIKTQILLNCILVLFLGTLMGQGYETKILHASRGNILDRNDKTIVYNQIHYNVYIEPMLLPKNFKEEKLINELGIKKNALTACLETESKGRCVIKENLSAEEIANHKTYIEDNDFLDISRVNTRRIPSKSVAQVLGYGMQNVDLNDSIDVGTFVGQSGIEASYDTLLRGINGYEYFALNTKGKRIGSYKEGELDTKPKDGLDIKLSLDIELQKYTESLLQNKKGCVVAIEPETGEILSLASSPNYNPNRLYSLNRNSQLQQLRTQEDEPLKNRTIQSIYSAGMLLAPVNLLFALEKNHIDNHHAFDCQESEIPCWDHYPVKSIRQALSVNCRPYIHHVLSTYMNADSVENQINEWNSFALSCGFGKSLGIDLHYEKTGELLAPEQIASLHPEQIENTITSLSLGDIFASPLQFANLAAIIANRGHYFTPHLLMQDSVWKKETVSVEKKHYFEIVEGMFKQVNQPDGIAKEAKVEKTSVSALLSTIENSTTEKNHSAIIAFAPKEEPKIALCVFIEESADQLDWVSKIASLVIAKYLQKPIHPKKEQSVKTATIGY